VSSNPPKFIFTGWAYTVEKLRRYQSHEYQNTNSVSFDCIRLGQPTRSICPVRQFRFRNVRCRFVKRFRSVPSRFREFGSVEHSGNVRFGSRQFESVGNRNVGLGFGHFQSIGRRNVRLKLVVN